MGSNGKRSIKNVTPSKAPESSTMTYEANGEMRHNLTKLSENFDEWSEREVPSTQLINQKKYREKEMKNIIKTMACKEDLKMMATK